MVVKYLKYIKTCLKTLVGFGCHRVCSAFAVWCWPMASKKDARRTQMKDANVKVRICIAEFIKFVCTSVCLFN